MIVVNANSLSSITLGRQGENLARQIVFDVSDWEAEYGQGVVELIAQRPGDEKPYPVSVKRDGTQVIWEITSVETEAATQEQTGKCELRYYVGDVLAKSKTWRLWVDPAMDTPSETAPPEPEQGWVDQILAVGAAAKASADAAKADADRAAALAAQAAEKAAQTAQDAETAAKAKEAAETAKRLAEDAQRAAETAQQAAEDAKAAAAQSATDAATAKSGAEAALKSAQDAAAAASQALEDLRALYQDMQTWAQSVVQTVADEGTRQVQAVQDEGTKQTANAKAQADAAALSAGAAAQSAKKAAENAEKCVDLTDDVNQLKSELSDLAPAGAAVGQLFRVAAISEDGKYTMEPVDMLDVQINGSSIVQDGVAVIPLSDSSRYGVAKIGSGLYASNGYVSTNVAAEFEISSRRARRTIETNNLDIAVKAAMCDGKGAAWTAEEQAAARERIGIPGDYELIESFTMTEAGIFDRNTEPDGTPYNFRKLLVFRYYPSTVDVSEATGWAQLYFFNSKGKALRSECGIPSKTESANISLFENNLNKSDVKYSRTYGISTGVAYLCSKPMKGYGWDIGFGNCVRVVVPSSDKEPKGTRIEIYGVRG